MKIMQDSTMNENVRYRCCGCCPVHVLTAGRILAVFLLVCTVINIVYYVFLHYWIYLGITLLISTPINLAFAYGVFAERGYFIPPFPILQAISIFVSIIMAIVYIIGTIFAYDKVKQLFSDYIKQSPGYDPKYPMDSDGKFITMSIVMGVAMVFGIALGLWFMHIGWRCYVFLRDRDAETLDASSLPVYIYNGSTVKKIPLP